MAAGEGQWRMPFAMQMVPGVLFLTAMSFQPESPRWLTEHGHYERAAKSLAFVAGSAPDSPGVQATLEEMRRDFEGRSIPNIWQQLKFMGESRAMIYRAIIPSLVMFFQQWTGTNAINYYSPAVR
jgi:hypothetical protein